MLYDIFCILWNIALVLALVAAAGVLAWIAFTLSSFLWPAALFLAAASIVAVLVK